MRTRRGWEGRCKWWGLQSSHGGKENDKVGKQGENGGNYTSQERMGREMLREGRSGGQCELQSAVQTERCKGHGERGMEICKDGRQGKLPE